MEKLLLIDGHNLFFQMFYGMPTRIKNKNGLPIQGIIGFIGALLKIIKMVAPTHLLVIFDGEHQNPRKELLTEYKNNRTDFSTVSIMENPFTQYPYILQALNYLNIKHFEATHFEADDAIATYTRAFSKNNSIIIASSDSDFFSLIRDNVKILRYKGKASYYCDKTYLKEKLHITPEEYILYKALVGDKADNIKGIAGVGPKTALDLIHSYSTLEGIIKNSSSIPNKRIQKNIINNSSRLQLNYQLIKLNTIENLPFSFKELEFSLEMEKTTMQILKELQII